VWCVGDMRVAIVGAGVCGLEAIKCCVDEGLEPVCYERTAELGGIWNYREDLSVSEEEGQSAMMYNTVTNACKVIFILTVTGFRFYIIA
jgi:dimethylaniline monooxygenase (N-oxide forming)